MSAPDLSPKAMDHMAWVLCEWMSANGWGMDSKPGHAALMLKAIAARDSAQAPSLHPLALATLQAIHIARPDDPVVAELRTWVDIDRWMRVGCPIWQTPPASPSTESAQASNSQPPLDSSPLSAPERAAAEPSAMTLAQKLRHWIEHGTLDHPDFVRLVRMAADELDRASREPAAPSQCGASWASDPFQPCSLPAGHDGPHQDNWGRWGPGLEEAMREPAAPAQGGTIRDGVEYIITAEADGRFSGRIPQRPGCLAEGDSLAECAVMLKRAEESWLLAVEDAEREGRP